MTEEITTYGLIGFPLGHSLSPCMHNTAFRALDVDAIYKLFPLKDSEVDPFMRALKDPASPIFGLNVTVPYKERVIPYLDALSPFAEKARAVNTIVIDEQRRLIGHNTDGPGFLSHLTELGVDPLGKSIALMGAGGAARAIVSVLCLLEVPPKEIRFFDLDRAKAQILIEDLGERIDVSPVELVSQREDLGIDRADILINATPVGLRPDDPELVKERELHEGLFVYDLIYNPAETRLLAAAHRCGCRGSNGLGMLLYQGVLAFQYWANMELPIEITQQMRMSLELGEVI